LQQRADEGAEIWLLTSRPLATSLNGLRQWDKVIVDIEDPWFDLAWAKGADQEFFLNFMRASDLVVANGSRIAMEYAMRSGRPVESLPNGIDAGFLELLKQDIPAPGFYGEGHAELRAVFTGHINDRLDFAMIGKVVKEPDCKFFFVGQENIPDRHRSQWQEIKSHPNVTWVPPRPHAEIAAVLRHADALLLP